MANRSQTYDVVVIGGGLSGLMAAAAARQQGADVAVLAEGSGMLELASGCIDLLGLTPGRAWVVDPWEALADLPPAHPYRMLGAAAVREALEAFVSVCAQMGLAYGAEPGGINQRLVTAVGRLRPTYLAAPGMAVTGGARALWVVGFRGLKEFHPGVVAEGLRAALPDALITWSWVDLPPGAADVHPVQLARLLEEPSFRDRLDVAAPRVCDLVLMPAVLGLDGAAAVRGAICEAVGAPVAEVPLLSPSIPGLRLSTLLQRYLQRAEVTLCLGTRVTGARLSGGRVAAVTAGATEFRAGSFVLATGGLLGQGLVVSHRTVEEPVFGLPVESLGCWADESLLPRGGHPFVRAGIRTDEALRPAGLANLHVCGRMLAGYDPYVEASGGGVAIASGWRAGLLAGTQAGTQAGGAVR